MPRGNKIKIYLAPFRNVAQNTGFTLVEAMVGLFIFAILTAGILSSYSVLSQTTKKAREKTALTSLVSKNLEIVRNMPYSQVGTVAGNPAGSLPDFTAPQTQKMEAFTYEIFYEVTYIDDPADGTALLGNDSSPADYKQVKMSVKNTQTQQTDFFVTNVAPQGLEGNVLSGSLRIHVIDASGQPVSGASIEIKYPTTTPTLTLNRQSDSGGEWLEVGLTPAVNNYRITVTKSGYSTDQTYPITVANPNPTKPDATILEGQVTDITFSIDLLSNLTIRTLDSVCQPVSGVNMNVRGAKLIGTNPEVYKYNQNHTSAAGAVALTGIEWDTYFPTLLTGQSWVLIGTSPIQQIDVLPGATQIYTMILGTNTTANSLLVIVKDASSGAALEGASVHLRKGGSTPQDYYGTTGGSVWVQNSWTGGSGLVDWVSESNRYFQDDGNVDINSNPTGVRLKKTSGRYALSGWLESATYDTGTGQSDFTSIFWDPTSQHPSTQLKFQIAANNDNSTWSYVGPDGSTSTYFTVPGSAMPSSLDNNRYFRYKVFLSTSDDKHTPVLTSAEFNYVSGCYTPGQTWFSDLTSGQNYDLDVNLAGYTEYTLNSFQVDGHQVLEVLMSP